MGTNFKSDIEFHHAQRLLRESVEACPEVIPTEQDLIAWYKNHGKGFFRIMSYELGLAFVRGVFAERKDQERIAANANL